MGPVDPTNSRKRKHPSECEDNSNSSSENHLMNSVPTQPPPPPPAATQEPAPQEEAARAITYASSPVAQGQHQPSEGTALPASQTPNSNEQLTATSTTSPPVNSSSNNNNSVTPQSTTNSFTTQAKTFLNEAGLRYRTLPSRGCPLTNSLFGFTLTGLHSSYRVVLETKQNRDRVGVYVHCPVKCPTPKLALVAEFIHRVNYSLDFGNAELDYDDGECRVRAGLDVEGGVLVPTMIKTMVHCAAGIMDRLFPQLMSLYFGVAVTARAAFDKFRTNDIVPPNIAMAGTTTGTATVYHAAAGQVTPTSSTSLAQSILQ